MRANAQLCVCGQRVALVPYRAYHVPKYHAWMQSAELQEQTASEPLSLEDEYSMCQSWRDDRDKCTFIMLDRSAWQDAPSPDATPGDSAAAAALPATESAPLPEYPREASSAAQLAEVAAMAGDVNLFFNDPDDPHAAEVEVMVAEPTCRRRGFGRESVALILHYAWMHLGMRRFVVKIGMANAPSLSLFEQLGFAKVSESAAFREVTLECSAEPQSERCGGSKDAGMAEDNATHAVPAPEPAPPAEIATASAVRDPAVAPKQLQKLWQQVGVSYHSHY
eukprot:m.86190 g.86190  ORF g.86190 m.86190 type:complete len:279 (+) comp14867_c0_seq2:145-981(+)